MNDPGIEVDDLNNLKACIDQMWRIAHSAYEIKYFVDEQVTCEDGFTGLLEPFKGAMGEIRKAASDLTGTFSGRYSATGNALFDAGFELDMADGHASDLFVRTRPN